VFVFVSVLGLVVSDESLCSDRRVIRLQYDG
jgi:hypothetical protein